MKRVPVPGEALFAEQISPGVARLRFPSKAQAQAFATHCRRLGTEGYVSRSHTTVLLTRVQLSGEFRDLARDLEAYEASCRARGVDPYEDDRAASLKRLSTSAGALARSTPFDASKATESTLLRTCKNRTIDVEVTLTWEPEDLDNDHEEEGGLGKHHWETACSHGYVCRHTTRRLAEHHMAAPWNWCEQCQALLDSKQRA